MSGSLDQAIDRGDLDELTRLVDRYCDAGWWDDLMELIARCHAAAARGRQLWPAAAYAEYRTALDAPGLWAASVLVEGSGRFSRGPLTEVVAARHSFGDLAIRLRPGPSTSLVAHERVIRGEDLQGDRLATAGGAVLELPFALQPWEPTYPVATYEADRAAFPAPPTPRLRRVTLPPPGPTIDDQEVITAMRDVVAGWTAESNGRADAVAVIGTAPAAVAALGPPAARMAAITPAAALAWLAWAGASGGAHGRRRGMATGRFAAWWALAALADRLDDWPCPPGELGATAASLRWYLWDAAEPVTGWSLHLAVEDPAGGRAWALAAADSAFE